MRDRKFVFDKWHFNDGYDWCDDPNWFATENLTIILQDINKHLLPFPDRIGMTVEEGIALTWHWNNFEHYLELYNDGDIGLIAWEHKEPLFYNKDLKLYEVIAELKKLFKKTLKRNDN